MIEVHRGPARRHMAIVTGVGTLNMIRRFAGCRGAVMTTRAGADDCGVVDGRYRFPGVGRVTIVAGVGGVDMRGVFAGGGGAIVTT